MHVSPGRFSDKTDREDKWYGIRWETALQGQTIATDPAPYWFSEPFGLNFADAEVIDGNRTRVRISGGVPGQSYRVRCVITVEETGETLEASTNDREGIPMQVLGPPVSSRAIYRVGGGVG